jgi:hypothetical protein
VCLHRSIHGINGSKFFGCPFKTTLFLIDVANSLHIYIWIQQELLEQSKAYVHCRLIAGITSFNPAEGMKCSSLVFVMCCVSSGLCPQADHSGRGVLPVVCLYVSLIIRDLEASTNRQPR